MIRPVTYQHYCSSTLSPSPTSLAKSIFPSYHNITTYRELTVLDLHMHCLQSLQYDCTESIDIFLGPVRYQNASIT